MSNARAQYVTGVLRGLQNVAAETIKVYEVQCKQCCSESFVRYMLCGTGSSVDEKLKSDGGSGGSSESFKTVTLKEAAERSSMILEGIFAVVRYLRDDLRPKTTEHIEIPKEFRFDTKQFKFDATRDEFGNLFVREEIRINVPEFHIDMEQSGAGSKSSGEEEKEKHGDGPDKDKPNFGGGSHGPMNNSNLGGTRNAHTSAKSSPPITPPKAKKAPKKVPSLSKSAKASTVPSSRIARVFEFGTLAAGLGIGTVAEITRRTLGISDKTSVGSTLESSFITPANVERIVNTLCKVRGAALKIGQILSIQDNNVISPQMQQLFERVRQSADFMPSWQVDKVMSTELGSGWRSHFDTFDMKPFAAASIGQVHAGVLTDGRQVAVKIQYPGVAKGIESDVDNLISVLNIWDVFPKGLFIDNLVDVAKKELAWEVDYVREAECTKKFKELLKPYPQYYVPDVIDHLCAGQVFTTELIEGISVDKCADMDQETRNYIANLIMELILRELLEFQYMQTDPNWSNFFFNAETKQLILLDFGSSRTYSRKFLDQYLKIIKAAVDNDRQKVLEYSRDLGFLTGYESKVMEEAHVDAVMILGEAFCENGFDFGVQSTTARIQPLVPTIINHRLCPPPEEIYSLHRKLSGAFLLFSKLKSQLVCRDMFLDMYEKYKQGGSQEATT